MLGGHVEGHVGEALQAQFARVHVDDERRRDQLVNSENRQVALFNLVGKKLKRLIYLIPTLLIIKRSGI